MHRRSTSSDFPSSSLPTPTQLFNSQVTTVNSPLPPPPPNTTQRPAHTNTFVHKLYNMVMDSYYQHLISWAYAGSSFIVCNIMEFSRDVLPKHFKHNNFSSFVRQLNMYGFHKVNKSPRGHRTLAENQIWEFSHPKFLRNRPDLLDDIKRKSMEPDGVRRDTGDLQHHVSLLQNSQSEMIQQIQHLYENFSQVIKELEVTKQKQESQSQLMKSMMNYIMRQNGGQLPTEFSQGLDGLSDNRAQEKPPSIFVTSHEAPSTSNHLLDDMFGVSRAPLTVQTQELRCHPIHHGNSLGPHGNQLPPSPSPSMLVSDDELDNTSSLYSANSPHTPRHAHHSTHFNSYMTSLDPLSHR
ncbi:HSF-type DNA-binding-domain-containing protein [Blakeslea trispora]|nr:HSF-type DNA-binding-domain-containing protein [Blakeslea trispora]